MRMIMLVQCPLEPFNTEVRKGKAGAKMKQILDAIKPEAAYFTEREGHRGGVFVVNVESPSDIPRFAEPWFLGFNAEVEFRIAMTPEDLGRADLESLGKKWA
ncbi:MAG: panthothenate synthetase [Acidobacteriota bacterium]|nr:panthothenate synthetase [Acidobacteriota bacterium]